MLQLDDGIVELDKNIVETLKAALPDMLEKSHEVQEEFFHQRGWWG